MLVISLFLFLYYITLSYSFFRSPLSADSRLPLLFSPKPLQSQNLSPGMIPAGMYRLLSTLIPHQHNIFPIPHHNLWKVKMCTWYNAYDFSKHNYQTAWPLDYFTVSVSVSSLFPTSSTMSQSVLVCIQEASEYICILLKRHNEEMLPEADCVWSCNHASARVWVCESETQRNRVVCRQMSMCTFWSLLLSDVQL